MISADSQSFLKRLLNTPGPSGFEIAAARVWRSEAVNIADRVDADVSGNSFAVLNPGGSPKVMLAGHIDEIGLMLSHLDEQGFLCFEGIGGWDPQVLVGQRVRILSRNGEVPGVIGKKPIHLMKGEEREKGIKLSELWIDIGAKDKNEVLERGVRVGDPAVIDADLLQLSDDLIASRSIDNRIGAFVVLEVLRKLKAEGAALDAEVVAVATTQEEIGYHGGGARTSAYQLSPDVALVVDVTFASDTPQIDKRETGEHALGSGPVLGRGSASHPLIFDRLVDTAEAREIPYTIQAAARFTATDADAIYLTRGGVATGSISVPNRYMHSPNEIVSLKDLEATVNLIASFITTLKTGSDFIPR